MALIHDDDVFESWEISGLLKLVVLIFAGEHGYFGAGVPQHVTDLIGRERGVEGDVDGAEGEGCKVGNGPFPAVLAENSDTIAFDNSPAPEGVGQGTDTTVEILRGDGLPGPSAVLPEERPQITASGDLHQHVVHSFQVKLAHLAVTPHSFVLAGFC